MDLEHDRRINQILEKVLQPEHALRKQFLLELCGDDRELYEELAPVVLDETAEEQNLEELVFDGIQEMVVESRSDPEMRVPSWLRALSGDIGPGSRVGPYRLESEIAEGGMGVVYKAAREEEFEMKVALKLVKAGLQSAEITKRFQKERQILAGLAHPNIARLLDGGTQGDRPFFVMEYVDGRPIDQWCSKNTLSVNQRLKLFLKVCDAVSFAHRNMVIHRDLKPHNILVTPNGEPKLLDFGIAGLMQSESPGHETITLADRRLMTPEYASPEQALGERLTSATDIYSLGVLFFELLTGHRPYQFQSRSPAEIRQIICHEPPPIPSTLFKKKTVPDDDGPTPAGVTRMFGIETPQMSRMLHGDLDNIVLKALNKDPAQRYGSVDAMAADIRRHLIGLPVEARAATLGYRTHKFIVRNKLSVLTAIIFAMVLAASSIAVVKQQRENTRERDNALQIVSFLTELFRFSEPQNGGTTDITARELLDKGALKVMKDLKNRPGQEEARAYLLVTLGQVYQSMGLLQEAKPLMEESLKAHRAIYPHDGIRMSHAMSNLASVLHDLNEYDRAEEYYRRSLAIRQKHYKPNHLSIQTSHNNLALLLMDKGRLDEAETLFLNLLDAPHQNEEETAPTYHNLAVLESSRGNYPKAEIYFQKVLEIDRRTKGADHPEVVKTAVYLGKLYTKMGHYEKADSLLQEAIKLRLQLFGKSQPPPANALLLHGILMHERGDMDRARDRLEKALSIYSKYYAQAPHEDTAAALLAMGNFELDLGNTAIAESRYDEALAILRTIHREDHHTMAPIFNQLALIKLQNGEIDRAIYMNEWALTIQTKLLGPKSPELIHSLNTRARIKLAAGRPVDAETAIDQALTMEKLYLNDKHPDQGETLLLSAELLSARGEHQQAEAQCDEALELIEGVRGKRHLHYGKAMLTAARLAYRAGNPEQGRRRAKLAKDILGLILMPDHRQVRAADQLLSMGLEEGR